LGNVSQGDGETAAALEPDAASLSSESYDLLQPTDP